MRIIEFIKKIIEVKNDDLSFLNVGDIIWARRYQTEEEKEKIRKGHRESPYVVIKKTKTKVYALQCTSNPHQEIKWNMLYYHLGRLNYELDKNSYISCLSVYELKEIQFVEMIGSLNEYDLNQLKKQLYILINSDVKIKPNIEKKYLDFKVGIGDIILYKGTRYYINSINDKEYETYRLRKNIKKGKSILINNTYYSFIFEKQEIIKIKAKYELVDTFNTGEIEMINNYKSSYLKRLEDKIFRKSLRVGAIIEYNDNMFYVYDEDDEFLFVYRIFFNSVSEKGMADVLVKNGVFRTFFNTSKIKKEKLKENGYRIRRCASNEEIEYNSMIFKLPKNQRIKMRKELHNYNSKRKIDDFVPMVILKNKNNNKYYLILSREGNVIEIVNINDMKDLYYFELDKEQSLFDYYRILSKQEFDIYLKKIQEFKDLVAMFDK